MNRNGKRIAKQSYPLKKTPNFEGAEVLALPGHTRGGGRQAAGRSAAPNSHVTLGQPEII